MDSEEYCVVESLRDYELLSSQIDQYRDKESSAEQERQRLEERTQQLEAENSRLRTQVGQQRLDVQELEAELSRARCQCCARRGRCHVSRVGSVWRRPASYGPDAPSHHACVRCR